MELKYTLVEFDLNSQGVLVTLEKMFFSIKDNIIYREDSDVNNFKFINKMQLSHFSVYNTSKSFKNSTLKIICNFMKRKD